MVNYTVIKRNASRVVFRFMLWSTHVVSDATNLFCSFSEKATACSNRLKFTPRYRVRYCSQTDRKLRHQLLPVGCLNYVNNRSFSSRNFSVKVHSIGKRLTVLSSLVQALIFGRTITEMLWLLDNQN